MSDRSNENGASPAYAYGRVLGELQRGMVSMFEAISAGFRDASLGRPLTAEQREAQREARSEALYRQRIQHERDLGRIYVSRLTRDLERRVGEGQ